MVKGEVIVFMAGWGFLYGSGYKSNHLGENSADEGIWKKKTQKKQNKIDIWKNYVKLKIETKKLPKCRFILVDKHGFLWGKTLEVAADLSLDLQMFIPRIKIKKRMNWMLFTSNKVWKIQRKILIWRKNLTLFLKLRPNTLRFLLIRVFKKISHVLFLSNRKYCERNEFFN